MLLTARWRPGRRVARTLYAMVGDTPSDDDVLFGLVDSAELAARICRDHNLTLLFGIPQDDADEGTPPSFHPVPQAECPDAPHRPPQGPNEDVAQCGRCWGLSHAMRPDGETYGHHLPDCRLPRRHESYCEPGGSGHPPAAVIRGYWPTGTIRGHGQT